MELITKISAAAVVSAVLSLIIKRTNPELSALLSLTVIAVITFAGISAAEGLMGIVQELKKILSGEREYLLPVIKCACIGLISKSAAELCRDSSQNSTAAAVETVGTLCAAAAAAPMISAALKLIGGLV